MVNLPLRSGATSAAAGFQVLLLIALFSRRESRLEWQQLRATALRTLLATVAMAAVVEATYEPVSVGGEFTPPPFNGAQTITVIATVDKLTNFATVQMSGRSLAFTPPVSLNLSTTVDPTLTKQIPFQLPATPTFIALTDPFTADLSGFTFSIQDVVVSTGGVGDTLTLNATTTSTNTGGTASFPGASGLITVPTTIGGTTTMTITWTVTDSTGLTGTGVTTVILTKTV